MTARRWEQQDPGQLDVSGDPDLDIRAVSPWLGGPDRGFRVVASNPGLRAGPDLTQWPAFENRCGRFTRSPDRHCRWLTCEACPSNWSGEWADTAVGLDGNHAKVAVLTTPDGQGQLELFEYIHPDAIETEPTLPNEIGMHRVAFSVDDIDESLAIAARHGFFPLRGVANYQDVVKLTYVRGPSGILVMLAQYLRAGA